MTIKIVHRYTCATIYRSSDAVDMRAAVLAAVAAGVDLSYASLVRADLVRASLVRANLDGANLDGANLDGASLVRANLDGASLADADLTRIRADVHAVLDAAPAEVSSLLAAVREGRVNGSVYEGACSCLLGTIAASRGVHYTSLGIEPDSGRPAEAFTLAIADGDTPVTSQHSARLERWIVEWMTERAVSAAT